MDVPQFITEPIKKDDLKNPVVELDSELPYSQISWENFEKLCHALAQLDIDAVATRPYGVKGDEQHGIDIYSVSNGGSYTVYQCKNEKDFGPKKIANAVKVFLDDEFAGKSERFVLCTRENLSTKLRTDELEVQRKLLAVKNVGFDVWDSVELNSKLKQKPQLVYNYFGFNWCESFCGKEKAKLLKLDEPLPAKKIFLPPKTYLERTVAESDEDNFAFMFGQQKSLKEMIDSHQLIALLAWGLDGKSTELQYVASELTKDEKYFPFLLSLGEYTGEDIVALDEDIRRVPQSKLVILLDGLDEVLPNQFTLATRKIASFHSKYPLAKIIVSCRTNYYTNYGDENEYDTLKGFKAIRLNQLGYEDIMQFLNTFLKEKKDAFITAVVNNQLYELLKVPYYLLWLAEQYALTNSVVNSKAELFKEEIIKLVKREVARNYAADRDKLEKRLYELLRHLAFIMEISGTTYLPNAELENIIANSDDRALVIHAATLFYGSKEEPKSWRFHHHNTQEYLTAENLAGLSLKRLKEIVGIDPDYKKIKPSWMDTLLFLNSILPLGAPLKNGLLKWLEKSNKDILVKMEPEKLDKNLRERVFKNIFLFYKRQARRINGNLYRYDNLASFGASENILKFLETELNTSSETNNIANALELVTEIDLRKYPQYQESYKQNFKKYLFGLEKSFHHSAIIGYTSQSDLTIEEFIPVFELFKDTDNGFIRAHLFKTIADFNFSEVLLDEIVKHVKLILIEERGRFQQPQKQNRLGTEYGEVAKSLNGIKSESALLSFFRQLQHDFLVFAQLTHFEKTLHIMLDNAAIHTGSTLLHQSIIDIFLSNHSYILNNINASVAFKKFFTDTFLLEQVASELCNKLTPGDASTINSISILASDETVALLHDLLERGVIDSTTVSSFNYFLEKNENASFEYFKETFNIPPAIIKIRKDFTEIQAENNERNLAALFDKELFIEEIKKIYSGIGKDPIGYDDTNYADPDYWSEAYAGVARDYLHFRPSDDPISLDFVINYIENNWDRFYYRSIYDYLMKNESAVLNEAQRIKIVNWCNITVGSISFKTALSQDGYQSWESDIKTNMFSYFLRRFSLIEYDKKLYLDMLSFVKHQDSLIGIIDFVKTVSSINDEDISATILTNLHTGVDNPMLLRDYVAYLKENKIKEATPLLIPYLQKKQVHNRSEILKLYFDLGGSIDMVETIVESMDEDFFPDLVEAFLTRKSKFIHPLLLKKFHSAVDESFKLRMAKYLTRLQDIEGINFYINYIKVHKRVPDDSDPTNPLYVLTQSRFTWKILDLIKFAHGENIVNNPYKDLRSISFTAFQNIALYNQNFGQVKRLMKVWIVTQKLEFKLGIVKVPDEFFKNLLFYWEQINKQHFVNAGKKFSIKQAEEIYISLKLN